MTGQQFTKVASVNETLWDECLDRIADPIEALPSDVSPDLEAYIQQTLPKESTDYVGLEHVKAIIDLHDTHSVGRSPASSAFGRLIEAAQISDRKAPSVAQTCIKRPDDFYTPERAFLLRPYLHLLAEPFPESGQRVSSRTTTYFHNGHLLTQTIGSIRRRDHDDYKVQAGYIVACGPSIAESQLRYELAKYKGARIGKTTMALYQIVASVTAMVE